MNEIQLIEDYMNNTDWRRQENANTSFSLSGLQGYLVQHATAEYMLQKVIPMQAAAAHRGCDIHIHDLHGMSTYCYGMDMEMFLLRGLHDEDGPPNHLTSALTMTQNLIYTVSQEIAGAIALNSFDVLLAPYVKYEHLTYQQVKQAIQEWVYTINEKGRISCQSPFTNIQLDITIPKRLQGRSPVIGGVAMDFTYDECTTQAEWIARAVLETLNEAKRVLAFPVTNVGITPSFNWDNQFARTMFATIGEIGQPTINNYVNSDYDPDSVRSMCCSLRLDMAKIMKQTGGSFGSADNSGSIGVVTLNLPRYAYLSGGDIDILYDYIDRNMNLARDVLLAKRSFVEDMHAKGMYPHLRRFVDDFSHFFNTIGLIGLNEMCWNFLGQGIDTPEGYHLSLQVMKYINNRVEQYQLASKDWYNGQGLYFNVELVPGEGCMYRLAKHDKEQFPDIITANNTDGVYYTRGCWLPVDQDYSLAFAARHQDALQNAFSGGANFQYYTKEPIHDYKTARSIVKKLVTQTSLPFISISPVITVCPICGKVPDDRDFCTHDLTAEQIAALKQQGILLADPDDQINPSEAV